MTDYFDIAPREQNREYLKHDECINIREQDKGNIDKCVWKRHIPTAAEIASPTWRAIEIKRIIKTGVLIAIKDQVVWLPGNYYFALNYGRAGANDLEFRVKRLKHVYAKIRARNNPGCLGTLTIKGRGDGETTMAITDAFYECLDGMTDVGQMGIQSMTRASCINPCWSYVQTLWQSLPQWVKAELCSDFISGTNIAEKIRFMREADEANGKNARNVLFTFYPSGTSMDGKHDMKRCILDEICKWIECNFYHIFVNYSKFIMPGGQRRGLFDMFSSPADTDCDSNREVKKLWDDSDASGITYDFEKKQYSGTTKSRIHRIYSDPLEGIAGYYDKFGDADAEEIYAHIMGERARKPKDMQLAEIRGFPLNEEEMWGSFEGGSEWSNTEGIKNRKIYLIGRRFKDERTKEPCRLYGNLEWQDGVRDSEAIFRQSDIDHFDLKSARFSISHLPQDRVSLKQGSEGALLPPSFVGSCLGIDPIDKRYAKPGQRGFSNAGMVNHVFRDVLQTGIKKFPTLIYSCRPTHAEIFFEDAIKAAVFCRSLVQTESINSKIIDYFEDRGYLQWMLSKRGQPRNSLIKGDSPTGGRNMFLQEIVGLIDSITNTPLVPGDPYLLENFWFPELIDDLLNFNVNDTHANDLVMAFGQSLMGSAKIMYKKIRQPSSLNEGVLDYLLG